MVQQGAKLAIVLYTHILNYTIYLCRCGDDLIILFNHPAVQSYLNGVPASSMLSHKPIYQPGAVRKVSVCCIQTHTIATSILHAERSIQFNNLEVLVQGYDQMTVRQIKANEQFTVLAVLPITTLVRQGGAVIGSVDRELINVGSFVQFSASPGEVIGKHNYKLCQTSIITKREC